jgi:hypothetical protein
MIDFNDHLATNRFLFAVSTTANPAGPWNAAARIARPVLLQLVQLVLPKAPKCCTHVR